jgi:poly(hydroxyalkanoate) depolymerase family esterase
MNRFRSQVLAIASLSLGLLMAVPARGASLTEVTRSTWAGSVNLPSYLKMFVYAPDKLATKPPIVVSGHSCGSTASGQMGNIPKFLAAADKNGFVLVLPDNPNQNCWDVGSAQALKHDGGGDTQGIAQMVKYALSKYSGDASRVYIFGGSSGGMLTQGMLAVYPDVFKAGSARAGVPAGCWAQGYASSNQWSDSCANGTVSKTGKEWGDLVRAMYPGYTGHRPRVQTMQGASDTTISYKNTAESIKEWTNVLGLSETPTSTDKGFKGQVASYDREFWKNACGYTVFEAWSSPGGTHSMGYEEDAILKFFGLDVAGGPDPEDAACSGDAGVGGTGGVGGGSGGTTGAGDGGPARDSGPVAQDAGGRDAALPDSGGAPGSGGTSGSGGGVTTGGGSGSGGASAKGGASGSAGVVGTGGSVSSGGSSAKGGSGGEGSGGKQGSGGATSSGGNSGTGGSTSPTVGGDRSSGSGCAVGGHGERSVSKLAMLLLAALGLIVRRQRRPGR